jgi:stage V sporulation protein S
MVSQQQSAPVALAPVVDSHVSPPPRAPSGEVKALKVSASSRPTLVAGAIAGMVRERGRAEVQAIGAAAINQAVKAVAIARGYMAPAGVDLICVPSFIEVVVDAEERTAIRFLVEPR